MHQFLQSTIILNSAILLRHHLLRLRFIICNGCNGPVGLWCSTLTCWHISHLDTYSAISLFILGHQLRCFRSRYILVLPGCMDNLDSCASCRTIHLTVSSLGTYNRCPIIKDPSSATRNFISTLASTFFLILDPSLSWNWAYSICSWHVGRTNSWATNPPPALMSKSALISFNSANCCSFPTVNLPRVALFLRLRASATTFVFPEWYSMVQS